MRDLKYITIILKGGFKRAILFNGMFTHKSIANGLEEGQKLHGAGFCKLEIDKSKDLISSEILRKLVSDIKVEVYGDSSSLDLKPQPDDCDIITGTVNCNDLI